MSNVKDALLRMVKVAMAARTQVEIYERVGLECDRLFQIQGDSADAIYYLIGEKTENFEDSITNLALTAPLLTNERRTEMLYAAYLNNVVHGKEPYTVQPKPYTMSKEDLRELFRSAGGYSLEVGELL